MKKIGELDCICSEIDNGWTSAAEQFDMQATIHRYASSLFVLISDIALEPSFEFCERLRNSLRTDYGLEEKVVRTLL